MESVYDLILKCQEKVFCGLQITPKEASDLFRIPNSELNILTESAKKITRKFKGVKVDVEQLNNIKKNGCSEDCSFCSQSAFYDTKIERYQLPKPEVIIKQAKKALDSGSKSYCLVAAWREPSKRDFEKVCQIIEKINKEVGINIECSLGFLTPKQASKLKELKVKRYNHNLETAKSKFSEICTTHTYEDRMKTLKIAREAGLELCTGGIIGIGETRAQRLELALGILSVSPEEVTINILIPIPGTPLELQPPIPESEIIKMFAILRFLLPNSIIKISGGREKKLSDSGEKLLQSGANGIITAGYLTSSGNEPDTDLKMISKLGLET